MTRWKESDLLKIQDKVKKEPTQYVIGIDVGTDTGFAVWDRFNKLFVALETCKIHVAMDRVLMWKKVGSILVRVEDARMVKYKTDPFKAKGAGSVCRDSSIWEDFLTDHQITFVMVRPNPALTKYSKELFNQITGFTGKSSVHARDAGLLCWKM